MKLPEFDSTDFNRLRISIGAAFIAAGILLPWLTLRDVTLVSISRAEISALTPTAQDIVAERQSQVDLIQHHWYWFSAFVIGVGITFVLAGALRIKELQRHKDDLLEGSAARARADIRRLSDEEIAGKIESDIAVSPDLHGRTSAVPVIIGETATTVLPIATDATLMNESELSDESSEQASDSSTSSTSELIESEESTRAGVRQSLESVLKSIQSIEESVLSTIERVAEGRWVVNRYQRIGSEEGVIEADALIQTHSPGIEEIIVEVKVVSHAESVRQAVDGLHLQMLRYSASFQQPVFGWLVLVVPDQSPILSVPDPASALKDVANQAGIIASATSQRISVSAILESCVDQLRAPPELRG